MKNLQLLPALFLLGSLSALAQSSNFVVSQNGHPVGTASFTVTPGPNGPQSTSQVHISMQGLSYALSKTEQLSPAHHFRRTQISATVNGSAVNVTASVDSAQYLLNVSANGRAATTRLDFHPAAVLLADFDPGALQTLLDLSNSPTDARLGLWAILPKRSTAEDGSTLPASIRSIEVATYRDELGTLDGQPIPVHHLIATISGSQTELFSGPNNQLLQAELPQQGFALVRNGFVLTPPARPIAPPAE
jgi:hypothetical protein